MQHTLSGCGKLASNKYLERHDGAFIVRQKFAQKHRAFDIRDHLILQVQPVKDSGR